MRSVREDLVREERTATPAQIMLTLPVCTPSLTGALRREACVVLLVAIALCGDGARAQDELVPESIAPSSAVLEAASAEYLTIDERREFRVRHGLYDDSDLDTPTRRALVMLERGRYGDAMFDDATVALELRAQALARAGRHDAVLNATRESPALPVSLPLLALRAASLAALGSRVDALALCNDARARKALIDGTTVEDILAAVDLGALRIRLDSSAAGEYGALLKALGRARSEIDALDSRVRLREAQLLFDRHAMALSVRALSEALALDPRASDAWRLLGEIALARFEFDAVARAVSALRRIDSAHPYAAILECASALAQDDPTTALAALEPSLRDESTRASALPWRAACEASRYDFTAMRATLAQCDALEPASAQALVIVGAQLVLDRQYAEARETLELAAAREPAWARPRAELGLLAMQDGLEARALDDLRAATALDPHDERTLFTLKLAQELASWKRIETAHFIIRHPDGDAALVAALLAKTLDAMHEEVCAQLGHEPSQKTLIDVMPDHRSFAVRITGLPRIHTIAVCTGPTIAIEIPKEGAQTKHLGLFDPLAVLRHEYTHTVTLSMTKNRIPHWLTEAVAVQLENTPRTFESCQLLANAWRRGALFDLDEINWAFVRPRLANDRTQAYAQGHWMVEFALQRFGWDAMRTLLFSYADGVREDEAMRAAFAMTRAEFFTEFLTWAAKEVRAWGLDPQPPLRELLQELVEGDAAAENAMKQAREQRLTMVAQAWSAAIGVPGSQRFNLRAHDWPDDPMPQVELDDATARAFLALHPEQGDLAEILLRRARVGQRDETEATRALLEQYARVRPVDPFPHRVWARLAGVTGDGDLAAQADDRALVHLAQLDARADKDNVYALAIARNRRAAGDLPAASVAIERAVRMNPFDASVRELAAAIAVEAGRLDLAQIHVEALVVLEPDRTVHLKRLTKLHELRGTTP